MGAGFEEVLRQMPAAVMIVEAPSGRIIFRNRRAQQWREQSPSQARATKLADAGNFEIYHPDGQSYEMEDWPLIRCIRTGEVVRDEEFVYPLADGSVLLLRCDASPIYDDGGHIVAGVGLFYDITERKRAVEEIEAKTHQQAVVAELGLKALAGSDLQSLMDAAVVLVARTLELEYSQVVEILPDGEELLIVAGGGGGGGGGGKTKGNGGFGAPAGGRPLSQKPGG